MALPTQKHLIFLFSLSMFKNFTAFALVKVSVYAIIGQLSSTTKAHSSLMNTIEGIFMLGVLSGYWVFAGFIDPNNDASLSWLNRSHYL